ncbi:hypothetical protein T12_12175, partial [Trichinella patagoniensis]
LGNVDFFTFSSTLADVTVAFVFFSQIAHLQKIFPILVRFDACGIADVSSDAETESEFFAYEEEDSHSGENELLLFNCGSFVSCSFAEETEHDSADDSTETTDSISMDEDEKSLGNVDFFTFSSTLADVTVAFVFFSQIAHLQKIFPILVRFDACGIVDVSSDAETESEFFACEEEDSHSGENELFLFNCGSFVSCSFAEETEHDSADDSTETT